MGETRWCPLPSAIGHAWLVCTRATKPWALPRVKCYQTKSATKTQVLPRVKCYQIKSKSATKPPVTTKTRVLPGQDGCKVAIQVTLFSWVKFKKNGILVVQWNIWQIPPLGTKAQDLFFIKVISCKCMFHVESQSYCFQSRSIKSSLCVSWWKYTLLLSPYASTYFSCW